MNGKVWLVGAGPSDVSLLTVKGKRIIESAEVVVYDQLVDLSILLLIPETAEAINAGKHAGNHTLSQDEINELLVVKAKEGKRVVRLKGGDPFVFGRGGEELEKCIEHRIPYEVVPGVASPIAVPAYAGIPVTHREFTPSFHVITAHRKRGNTEPIDYKALAALQDVTLVFLMGIGALDAICEGLIKAGVEKGRPAAVIQNGARYNQRVVRATLETLSEEAKKEKIGTPGIIVVGSVCKLREQFLWAEKRPLATKRIIVTRPKEKADELSETLRELGAEVLKMSVTSICSSKDQERLDRVKKEIGTYSWLVFTSESGVSHFFSQMRQIKLDLRKLCHMRMAVIGEATANALERNGFIYDLMPECHYGEELAKAVASQMKQGEKALIITPANKKSRCYEAMKKICKENGLYCDSLSVYQTEYRNVPFFTWSQEDVVTFTSPSCVDGFVKHMKEDDYGKVQAVCIGKHTLDTAISYGMQAVQSDDTTMQGMVGKILEMYSKQ